MSELKGVVQRTSSKDVKTKWGNKKTYSIMVDGKWIGCGFKDPGANTGDTISCEVTEDDYGLKTSSVAVVARGSGASEVASPSGGGGSGGKTYVQGTSKPFPIPPLHGDRAIVRQNATARATELFIAARGGKPFELEVGTLEFIINLARGIEAYTAGDLDLKAAKEALEGGA